MRYVLGVDAGASKTSAVVADETGRVAGEGRAGPGNHQVVGLQAALEEMARAAHQALRAGGVRPPVDQAVLGLAGADLPRDFQLLIPAVQGLGLAQRVRVENDTLIALRAGTTRTWGVVVVCGAGFNAAGISPSGTTFRLPGLGWMSGDWGGGTQIAQEMIRLVCRAWDGRGRPTKLQPLVLQALGVPSVPQLIDELYQLSLGLPAKLDWQKLHTLVPLLFEAAGDGDDVAQGLVVQIGKEVGVTAVAIIRRLDLAETDVEVVLAGSVFRGKGPLLVDTATDVIRQAVPRAQVRRLDVEPVAGAVLWALEELDVPSTTRGYEKLREHFAKKERACWGSAPNGPGKENR